MNRVSLFLYFLLVLAFDKNHAYELHTLEQMRQGMGVFIDEPEACSSNHNIVILVKTAVVNFPHRRAIRETWAKSAKQNHNIGTLFVVARSLKQDVMDQVNEESKQHRDILMADFVDSYYNLTLKTVFTLNWINQTCRSAFAAIVDDDVILNPENLLQLTESGRVNRSLHCFPQLNARPVRDPLHKNYMPQDLYPADFWPNYCVGQGVVMSGAIAGDLVAGAFREDTQPKVYIEDVFMFGIVAEKLGISVIDEPAIRTYGFASEYLCFPDVYKNRIFMGIIAWHEMPILWDAEQAKETQGCLPTHRKRWFIILMSCMTVAAAVAVIAFVVLRRQLRKVRFRRLSSYMKDI